MAHDIYQAIQEHAPANSPAAAGNLHEEIWLELLRRSDSGIHNVRVTAGDGGLDGVGFQDPVTGVATVYQAKFFKDLAGKQHRADLAEAFTRACAHPFVCHTWILLLPKQLSATDLGWLIKGMREDALLLAADVRAAAVAKSALKRTAKAKKTAVAKPKKKLPNIKLPVDIDDRLTNCGVTYREGQDLGDLLRLHLDVAGRLLPESALSLASELQQVRAAFDLEQRNTWELLAELRESSIRRHQIASRRARAALAMLNQGWTPCAEQLRMVAVSLQVPGITAARVAADVEALAGARAQYAFHCEGLVPGIREVLSLILYGARKLHAAAGLRSMLAAGDDAVETTAQQLRESIETLQGQLSLYANAGCR